MSDNQIDKSALDQVLNLGGIELLNKLIVMFDETIIERLNAADSAVKDQNLTDILREVHSMRSSAGNLGASILSSACLEVEKAIRDGVELDWEGKLKTIRELHGFAHQELVAFAANYTG